MWYKDNDMEEGFRYGKNKCIFIYTIAFLAFWLFYLKNIFSILRRWYEFNETELHSGLVIAHSSILAIFERGFFMSDIDKTQILCKSVFKSGENTTSREQFTKKWIELINRMEKNKEIHIMK